MSNRKNLREIIIMCEKIGDTHRSKKFTLSRFQISFHSRTRKADDMTN